MFRVSAFADEISPDLSIQLDTLAANGVGHIELRGVGGKGVLDLTEAEVHEVARRASECGVGFSAIGSPLGKFPLSSDFALQIEALKKALNYAAIVGAPYIRIFSFHIPKDSDPGQFRGQVMEWLGQMVAEAEKTTIVLAHENEKGIYGDTGARCLDMH
jgi:sugar phosphate isomerase/epimerase